MQRLLLLLSGCVSLFLTICTNSYPRAWWQDLVADRSAFVVPVCVLVCLLVCVRARRHHPRLLLAVLIPLLLVVGRAVWVVATVLWPIHLKPAPAGAVVYRMWGAHLNGSASSAEAIAQAARERSPDILLLWGRPASTVELLKGSDFTWATERHDESGLGVAVLSKVPWTSESVLDFGVGALPAFGMEIELRRRDGVSERCLVGVMQLLPRIADADFQVSRTTSRRMSSLIKAHGGCAVLMGGFEVTDFSRLITLFTDQVDLAGLPVGRLGRIFGFPRPLINVLVSEGAGVTNVVESMAKDEHTIIVETMLAPKAVEPEL